MSFYIHNIKDLDFFMTEDNRSCKSNAADNYELLHVKSCPRSECVYPDDIF